MGKNIRILLLATNYDDSLIFLSCLLEAGFKNIFIAGPPGVNRETRYFPICKKFFDFPEKFSYKDNVNEIFSTVAEICAREKIDVILPSGFDSQRFVSLYHEALERIAKVIPASKPEIINLLNNKHSFSIFCQDHQIPHPKTLLLERWDQLHDVASLIGYPVLTKPLALSSGKGILKFEQENDLSLYLHRQENSFNELPILIQEYIPGEDVDFNGFAVEGVLKAWTIQKFLDIPFKGRSLRWYQFVWEAGVFDIGRRVIESSRYSGAIHIDLRYDQRDKTYKSIEVNPRFWASTFYSVIDGVNFVDVAIKAAFHRDLPALSPKCSGKIWGSPHHLPYLLSVQRSPFIVHYALKHTLLQLRYIIQFFIIKCWAKFRVQVGVLRARE